MLKGSVQSAHKFNKQWRSSLAPKGHGWPVGCYNTLNNVTTQNQHRAISEQHFVEPFKSFEYYSIYLVFWVLSSIWGNFAFFTTFDANYFSLIVRAHFISFSLSGQMSLKSNCSYKVARGTSTLFYIFKQNIITP